MPAISLTNISKTFQGVHAIDRVSFDVEDGEYLCVLGPTGSGKTTLLRLIAGLLNPDEGTIYFDGNSVNRVEPQDRNAVYVPQQYALFPHLTILQNVAFGPLARQKTEEDALRAAWKTLEMVRLSWRAQAYPSELSGGMQQRVALARGLASGARLLLLDEPLGALDARLRLDLRHRLRDLVKQSGITAIHVTHDRDEAMSLADRILVLRGGRIQDLGTPRRVYLRPNGIFVANLIGGANLLEGIVDTVTQESSTVRMRGGLIIKAPGSSQLTTHESVIFAVRKESVEISTGDLQRDNVLKGEIREVRFLGNSREYLLRLTNGDVIAGHLFVETAEPDYKVGDHISVGFDQSDTVVFGYPPQGLMKELEIA